jgi:heme/copper-type cytochrome/quinol oxidase subunit 3
MIAVTQAQPRTNGWWGMLLFLVTEATLFGVLIATYFYLRFKTPEWPPDGIAEPKLLRPLAFTAILVFTSVPMYVAVRVRRRGLFAANVLAALLIGALYLWLQSDLLRENAETFTPRDNAYGSIYYTLSVGHAAHVFVGLLLNLWLLGRPRAVDAIALYWHAVNVLAVAVVLTVLSPSL